MGIADERAPRPAFGLLKRAALGAVAIVLLSSVAVATAALLQVKQAVDVFVRNNKPLPRLDTTLDGVDAGGPQDILVLGSDKRYTAKRNDARSDTILLIRLDPGAGVTSVLSVPRDLKVRIPEAKGPVTAKINQAYSDGGPGLVAQTVRGLLGVPIHHVINVNFGGFRSAVDRLGCVYVDVDRRYFHSNAGLPSSQQYAEINIKPGYQKLCGQQALDYVRFRHADNDFVRAARQQDFLRQAKDQIGIGRLVGDREELLAILGQYTQTDIRSNEAVLRLLKLALESAGNPIQQVRFNATEDNTPKADYVVASGADLRRAGDQFLHAEAPPAPPAAPAGGAPTARRPAHRKVAAPTSGSHGLVDASSTAREQAAVVARRAGFPVLYPRLAAAGASYVSDPDSPRAYRLADQLGATHQAYRLVAQAHGDFGQYYGVQGTTWLNPPLLANPSETVRVGGRDLELFWDGHRLRLVAWRTPRAVYWVSNTLLEALSPKQMLGIARSLTRLHG